MPGVEELASIAVLGFDEKEGNLFGLTFVPAHVAADRTAPPWSSAETTSLGESGR